MNTVLPSTKDKNPFATAIPKIDTPVVELSAISKLLDTTIVVVSDDSEITFEQKKKLLIEQFIDSLYVLSYADWFDAYDTINYYFDTNAKIPQTIQRVCIANELILYGKDSKHYIAIYNGYSYIYNHEFWILIDDTSMKQLLTNSAIKMGIPRYSALESKFSKDMLQQIQHSGYFDERIDTTDTLLNVQNGTLHISNNGVELKPFDYRDFMTHQLDIKYEPTVVNDLWINFLEHILPDEDTRKTLQQSLGSLIVRGIKLEKVIFLYGTGSNGKSVIFEVLTGILGEDNISNYSIKSLTDDKGYHRANIQNKLVNYGTDVNLAEIDAGMFKTLASGEPIEARLPYKEPIIIKDYARLIFNVNKIDDAQIENTHGFFRRMLFIPFNTTITEEHQDPFLAKKLLQNKEGILSWLIEGAKEVISNKKIFESDVSKQFTSNFASVPNNVVSFIKEVHITVNNNGNMEHGLVYRRYQLYCTKTNTTPVSTKVFSKVMKSKGFEQVRKSNGMVWRIRINK